MLRPKIIPLDSLPLSTQKGIESGDGRVLCPVCGGGSTKERSLSILPTEHIGLTKLTCWRSTCGFWGYVTAPGVEFVSKRMHEPRPFNEDTIPLQGEQLSKLQLDYGLDKAVMHARPFRLLRDNPDTLVYPVRDQYGREIGHATRTLSKPKRCMTYKQTAGVFMDFWRSVSAGAPTVIVEDCLSACRLRGLNFDAVALLGTNMSAADAKAIASFHDGEVYIALDADAWDKSMKYVSKYAHILTMIPIPLTLDIKDIQDDREIERMFGCN